MDVFGAAVVHGGRGHQAEPGVPMVMVVVLEELAAEAAGVLDAVEAGWERGPVLERFEVRFGVGVVGRGVGAVVAAGDAEIGQQKRDRLGGHRAAPGGGADPPVTAGSVLVPK